MTDPNIFFHKVNVQTYPLFKHQPFDIAFSSTIYQVVKLYKLDILHAHYAIPYAYAAFFAKINAKRRKHWYSVGYNTSRNRYHFGWSTSVYKHAVEFSINQSDKITTVVSESLKSDTLKFLKSQIEVITNFIDNTEFEDLKLAKEIILPMKMKILIHRSNLVQ